MDAEMRIVFLVIDLFWLRMILPFVNVKYRIGYFFLRTLRIGVKMEIVDEMLKEAFDRGYDTCSELKDAIIKEIASKYEGKLTVGEVYRQWKVEELNQLPVGTIFSHSILGECRVLADPKGIKYMKFSNPKLLAAAFNKDDYPWDSPMKRVS